MSVKEGNLKRNLMRDLRGQITIFIIIAIVVVAIVLLIFTFRGSLFNQGMPSSLAPVYNSFTSCMEQNLQTGINVLESQGGYIYLPAYSPGSQYMPFSSQLTFGGIRIPYWYYISANNIEKEQIPSINDMEKQLEQFVEAKAYDCYLGDYYSQGYQIYEGSNPKATINIKDSQVTLDLNMDLTITKDKTVNVKQHNIVVDSNLGLLYSSAKEVYNAERKNQFLENYSIDALRLYAPVDGVDFSCSPEVWNANQVFNNIQEAVEANIYALKVNGVKGDYFTVDVPVKDKVNVQFLNSRNWSNAYEVSPSDGAILRADPVGTQSGLGILGFCYVPYHFLYNMKYPVLVQVYSSVNEEIFQFPLAVVLEKNQPLSSVGGASSLENSESAQKVCQYSQYANTSIQINTYDKNLNSVDAQISYECAGASCNVGDTVGGELNGNFPQCVNGYVVAQAKGYTDARVSLSTVTGGSVSIYMDKIYNRSIKLYVDGKNYNGQAVINFNSNDSSASVFYPFQKNVELPAGDYEVQVYTYANTSIALEASTQQQCTEVPRKVIGFLGATKQECTEVQYPAQVVSQALSGGGAGEVSLSENELKNSNFIQVDTQSLPVPGTIVELQNNYVLYNDNTAQVSLG